MTVEARKRNLIDKIRHVNENWLLKSLEKLLSDIEVEDVKHGENQSTEVDLSFYVGNIEEKVDLEKIKMERPLKRLDMNEFEKMADSLEWDNSIEELLEDLK